jgi:hypothetical protein
MILAVDYSVRCMPNQLFYKAEQVCTISLSGTTWSLQHESVSDGAMRVHYMTHRIILYTGKRKPQHL